MKIDEKMSTIRVLFSASIHIGLTFLGDLGSSLFQCYYLSNKLSTVENTTNYEKKKKDCWRFDTTMCSM